MPIMMMIMSLQKRLPFNSLEKFMMAHETDKIAYNSQIVLEFEGHIQPEAFKEIIRTAVCEIPWLRTSVKEKMFSFDRRILNADQIDLNKTLEVRHSPLTQEELDQFCATKFDLENGFNFKFMLAPLNETKDQLIFNIHHTLCDAAGHFLLMEEFFRLMNNLPVRPEAKKTETFRYRDLWKIMGTKWVLTNFWKNKKALKSQRQYKMAGLIDHPTNPGRTVSSMTFHLNEGQKNFIKNICKDQQASCMEYLTFSAFQAYDLTLRERGDFTTPIMAYVPKTLRPYLKIRYSFQNILSTVLIVGKRDDVHQLKFLGKIKHIIQSHKMDQAAKFIFSTLLPGSLATTKKLKQIFKDLDNDPESITSSMLVSAGKVPRSYTFPNEWKNISIWARGTMLKSPGIGVIYTGNVENETITLEFVKELTDRATMEALKKNLLIILSPAEAAKEDGDIANISSVPSLEKATSEIHLQ